MNPIVRDIARFMVALVVILVVINTLAGLAGCSASPQPTSVKPPALYPVDCRHWAGCA